MNAAQRATAERLRVGIEQIAEAVNRLNSLGFPLGVPPVAIRFSGTPQLLFGEVHYSNYVGDLLVEDVVIQ